MSTKAQAPKSVPKNAPKPKKAVPATPRRPRQPKARSRGAKRSNKPLAARTNDAQQVSAIIEAITMPKEAAPIKLGTSKFGGDPTGACNPFQQVPLSLNTISEGAFDSNRTNVMFAFRSLLRSNVYSYLPNGTITYAGTDQIELVPGDEAVFTPGALRASTALQPHGLYLYPGRLGPSDPHRGFWVDAGSSITVSVPTPSLPPTGLFVKIQRARGRSWIDSHQGNLVPGASPITQYILGIVPTSGYYSFTIGDINPAKNPLTGQPYAVTVAVSWNTSAGVCYGHLSVPDVHNQFGSIDAVRINALSVMFTNTSAAISKTGTLCGVQFDAGTVWTDSVEFQHFSTKRKATIMESAEGMYGFHKPTGESDFDLLREFAIASDDETAERLSMFPLLSDTGFDLIPETSYLGIAYDVTRVNGAVPGGITAYWTRAFGVEYITNDQWRALSKSNLAPENLTAALHLLSETPQWHTNEFHLSDLWNTIKSFARDVVQGVIDYGPTVLKGATMLAPLLI